MNLVIVNGPCGVGKSTASRLVNEAIPGSLLLEVDAVRRNIPGYIIEPGGTRRTANRIAAGMAIEAMALGRSVVVDGIMPRGKLLDLWWRLGERHGADVSEFYLHAPRETVLDRAAGRGYAPGHRFTEDTVANMYDRVAYVYADGRRPEATIIDTTRLSPSEVGAVIIRHLVGYEPGSAEEDVI
jgi:predicted kinase